MKAWDITIEGDEDGFVMRVRAECEDGSECEFQFNIHDVAEQLYKGVKREIGPWLYEMEMAKATMPARMTREGREELEEIAAPGSGFPLHEQVSARQELDAVRAALDRYEKR